MTTNIFINFLYIIGRYFSLYEIKLKQRAELELFQVTKSLIIDQNYSNCLVFMTKCCDDDVSEILRTMVTMEAALTSFLITSAKIKQISHLKVN